jgi:hypothetical protein
MRGRIRIAIACTGLLLVTTASARAQTTFRETGSVTVGGYLIWVRGTNAKVVELFVGRGFRDAFAKAHEMDAAKLQQWIDSVRAVSPVPADDSTAVDAQLRGAALGTDVTMMRRVGGSYSGLRLLVSGEDPIKMAEPTARDFIAMLDSAARVTRELSVPPAPIMASMPMQTTAPVSNAPPELVLAAPSEPVARLANTVDVSPLPTPTIAPQAPVAMRGDAPVAASVAATVLAPAPDTVVPPHAGVPPDKLIRTPLGPFTIPGAILSDRDKQAQYCYTQLGLKYNPDLKGEITVKLSLRSDGAVQDAVVTKRSWQGISAGEVESCVRALAHDWTFASSDPSITDGSKLLTFSFAP